MCVVCLHLVHQSRCLRVLGEVHHPKHNVYQSEDQCHDSNDVQSWTVLLKRVEFFLLFFELGRVVLVLRLKIVLPFESSSVVSNVLIQALNEGKQVLVRGIDGVFLTNLEFDVDRDCVEWRPQSCFSDFAHCRYSI